MDGHWWMYMLIISCYRYVIRVCNCWLCLSDSDRGAGGGVTSMIFISIFISGSHQVFTTETVQMRVIGLLVCLKTVHKGTILLYWHAIMPMRRTSYLKNIHPLKLNNRKSTPLGKMSLKFTAILQLNNQLKGGRGLQIWLKSTEGNWWKF